MNLEEKTNGKLNLCKERMYHVVSPSQKNKEEKFCYHCDTYFTPEKLHESGMTYQVVDPSEI